ncbi:MAG TPA: hypothetical protein VMV49_11130 [Candidatus Deferrimicrobium sp.]|nr:hypothetical protein [Candidatus Deferrimicrobium sp.]
MSSINDFSATNYITLRQFPGGWIWLKNIDEISARIIPDLQKLSVQEAAKIAVILNGIILPWHIFDDTQWVLRLIPLPNFIILIIFNHDEEFGSALKIFYHKTSLIVPTEDAYVFTEIYLELFGQLAKYGVEKASSTKFQEDLIALPDLLDIIDPSNKTKLWNDIIGQRQAPLLKINLSTAENISSKLSLPCFTKSWKKLEIDWAIPFTPLKNMYIIPLLFTDPTKFEVYYTKNVLNFESRRILFFTWLYCNAIIRKARTILGNDLPKLSEYL